MVPIDGFTPSSKDGAVWYIVDGKEYVRPHSKCKACMSAYNKERYTPTALRGKAPQELSLVPTAYTAEALINRPDWLTMDAELRAHLIDRLEPDELSKLMDWFNRQ
jgi:hypothetical protein